jgi:hypothetical protein
MGKYIDAAKAGFARIEENVLENKRNGTIFALEVLASLYSRGMLTDPTISSGQGIFYTDMGSIAGVDALLRLVTGQGIDTYVRAGMEYIAEKFGKHNSNTTPTE